jgi:hypothetical protein
LDQTAGTNQSVQMKPIPIRYKMRPETIGQDRQPIEGGFAEFHAQLLEGVRNVLAALDDGSFFRAVETAGDVNPMIQHDAFNERCAEPPNAAEPSVLGNNPC